LLHTIMARNWMSYRRVPADYDEDGGRSESILRKAERPSRRLLLIIIAVETMVLIWSIFSRTGHKRTWPSFVYSPAQDVVEYKLTKFAIGGDKHFHIPPSDALDEAWNNLYNFGISRIPKSQAALLPNKTHPIPGDDGYYIVELDVFHNLHCLNMIRKTLHSDYYTHMAMNVNDNGPHMDHCVDWLRQSLMCAGDTSVIVWQWDEEQQKTTFQGDVVHTCRDFDKLRDWGTSHALTNEYDSSIRVEDDIVIPVIHS